MESGRVAPSMLGHGTSLLRMENERRCGWATGFSSSGDSLDEEATEVHCYVPSGSEDIEIAVAHTRHRVVDRDRAGGSRVPRGGYCDVRCSEVQQRRCGELRTGGREGSVKGSSRRVR